MDITISTVNLTRTMRDTNNIRQALPEYGSGLLTGADNKYFSDCLVFCAPESWELVRHVFTEPPRQVVVPESMEQKRIEAQISSLPEVKTVFGIGGGSACDAAKLTAAIRRTRFILAPTILSVDAPFTSAIGVRVDGRVRYIGEVYPDHLLIDFELLKKAPHKLNRAGIGDILSIYTALWDWRLAAREKGESFDQKIAEQSQGLLDRMFQGVDDLRQAEEKGLRLLAELYVGEVALCERFGNSRPEEGSEHYFAYCLEWITGKHYLHGELIVLAVIITSIYQGQPVESVLDFCRRLGVNYRPKQIGVEIDEIKKTLLALPEYLDQETQLLYGVYHHKGVNETAVDRLLAELDRFDIL